MTSAEFKTAMQELTKETNGVDIDIDAIHRQADEVICQLLSSLGYQDGVEEFRRLQKKFSYNYVRFTE